MRDGAHSPPLYPRYCFDVAPTFNKWCFLRATDVISLRLSNKFEGQDYFFHKNLPIRWVRVVGIIVAIDDYNNIGGTRRVLTVDDSSGATVECTIEAKCNSDHDAAVLRGLDGPPPPEFGDFDVGHVVDVKGSLSTFRGGKQINVRKVQHVRSTAEEVSLWEKRVKFRRHVLDHPWILSNEQIRKCELDAEESGGAELAVILGKRKLKDSAFGARAGHCDPYRIQKKTKPEKTQEQNPQAVGVAAQDPFKLKRKPSVRAMAVQENGGVGGTTAHPEGHVIAANDTREPTPGRERLRRGDVDAYRINKRKSKSTTVTSQQSKSAGRGAQCEAHDNDSKMLCPSHTIRKPFGVKDGAANAVLAVTGSKGHDLASTGTKNPLNLEQPVKEGVASCDSSARNTQIANDITDPYKIRKGVSRAVFPAPEKFLSSVSQDAAKLAAVNRKQCHGDVLGSRDKVDRDPYKITKQPRNSASVDAPVCRPPLNNEDPFSLHNRRPGHAVSRNRASETYQDPYRIRKKSNAPQLSDMQRPETYQDPYRIRKKSKALQLSDMQRQDTYQDPYRIKKSRAPRLSDVKRSDADGEGSFQTWKESLAVRGSHMNDGLEAE